MSDSQTHISQQHQIIYQQVVKAPSNGMAVAALVLGIVAIVAAIWIPIPILGLIMMFLAFVPAVLAVIFGHIGFRNSARVGGIGRGSAMTGFILGYATLAISVLTTAFWIAATVASAATSQ